jgi:hypothetical protein
MGKRQTDTPAIAEHYLWNFIYSMQLRAQRKDSQLSEWENTLEHVARLVEQVLKGNRNPLPKKRGRNPNSDIMWMCFHHMFVVPFTSEEPRLRRHSETIGGFNLIGTRLNLSPKTVGGNCSNASKKWETRAGRQEYISWLNLREKRWEAYQALLDKRDPAPREYVLPAITTASLTTGEPYVLAKFIICSPSVFYLGS